jgi:metal-responsive CopG/Arc/MetJ family transcriptional regulator
MGARVKRKIGRPKVGRGAVSVSISLERGLLERVDADARRGGMTRSAYLGRIIKNALAP